MGLYIGIDGGGTKTKCVLADDQLKIIASAQAGATNPFSVGINNSSEILFGLIQNVLKKVGGSSVSSVVIGLAGAGIKNNSEKLKKHLKSLAEQDGIFLNRIKVLNDAEITLEGAFAGNAGIILIAGTGSIVLGKNNGGQFFRVGGFGKIIGDEGSGYSIGRKGLQCISKNFDGRGGKTLLTKIVTKKFGINNNEELIAKVYSSNFNVAGFAEYVIDAARLGDKTSREILMYESDELINHIFPLYEILGSIKINLCFSGGLLLSKNYYSNLLRRKIKKVFKDIQIKQIIYPPEIGAVLLSQNFQSLKSLNKK